MPGYNNRGGYGGNRGGSNRGGGNTRGGNRNSRGDGDFPDLRGTLWGNNFRNEGSNEPALQGFVTVGGVEYRAVAFVNTSGKFREDAEAQNNAIGLADDLSGMLNDAFQSDGIQLGLSLQPRDEWEAQRAENSRGGNRGNRGGGGNRGGRSNNGGGGNRNRQNEDDAPRGRGRAEQQQEDDDIPFDNDNQEDDARPVRRQRQAPAPAKGGAKKPGAKAPAKRGAKK